MRGQFEGQVTGKPALACWCHCNMCVQSGASEAAVYTTVILSGKRPFSMAGYPFSMARYLPKQLLGYTAIKTAREGSRFAMVSNREIRIYGADHRQDFYYGVNE
jgi:hypothetical protein